MLSTESRHGSIRIQLEPHIRGFQILSSPLLGELPLIFGTFNLLGGNTILENETSHYMQGAWVSFAKDPAECLVK